MIHRSTISVNPVNSVQLSDALQTRNEAGGRRRGRPWKKKVHYASHCESSGSAYGFDLLGADNSAAVEIMDEDAFYEVGEVGGCTTM